MDIPAGFQLQVTTWENDGDNYKTQVISGLSKMDVNFYLRLISKFERDGGYGNDYHDIEEMRDVLETALVIWKDDISHELRNRLMDIIYGGWELAEFTDEFLGRADEYYDGAFFRMVDEVVVFDIVEPIKDVTKRFL